MSTPAELSLSGFIEQLEMDKVDGPLTENEQIKREIKELETTSITARHETVPGLR